MPLFTKGTQVEVYMGAGWLKGTVSQSDKERCSVWLGKLNRTTIVKDARNIKRI
jgi:hypothetical protein